MFSDKAAPEVNPFETSKKPPSRVDTVHGGEVVEEIETPIRITPLTHEHEWVLDPSETDFIAYMCTDAKCGEVRIFDK